jgi:hypothetical protein
MCQDGDSLVIFQLHQGLTTEALLVFMLMLLSQSLMQTLQLFLLPLTLGEVMMIKPMPLP